MKGVQRQLRAEQEHCVLVSAALDNIFSGRRLNFLTDFFGGSDRSAEIKELIAKLREQKEDLTSKVQGLKWQGKVLKCKKKENEEKLHCDVTKDCTGRQCTPKDLDGKKQIVTSNGWLWNIEATGKKASGLYSIASVPIYDEASGRSKSHFLIGIAVFSTSAILFAAVRGLQQGRTGGESDTANLPLPLE